MSCGRRVQARSHREESLHDAEARGWSGPRVRFDARGG